MWVLRRAGPHTNKVRWTWMFCSFSSSKTMQTTPFIERTRCHVLAFIFSHISVVNGVNDYNLVASQVFYHCLRLWSENCFYYCSKRNNVVVLFGTLKVQSFMLTEVRDCDLLIVVTSSTFLKGKDMLKEKKAVSPDHQNPQHSIYIDKCTVYTYTVYMYTAL